MDALERMVLEERGVFAFLLSEEFGEFDMTKEQAEALAARIRQQLPFHIITVAQSMDMRNAPRNWFLGVKPSGEWTESMLIIQSQYDWQNALLAWRIIGA